MRTKMVAAGIVLASIVVLCVYSLRVVERDTTALRALAESSINAAQSGDDERALALVGEAIDYLEAQRPLLEVLTLHEAINRIDDQLIESRTRLVDGQKEEYNSAMAQLIQSITVLYEQQKPSWSNLM